MADAELGPVTVNGKPVEIPDVLSINLDEATTVYDLYGVSLDEVGGSAAPRLMVLRALLHVGVQRAEPDANPDDVKAAVGQVQLGTLMAAVRETDEGDALPPAFSKNSSGNGTSSGHASVTSSTVPVHAAPATSGTPASGSSE